MARRSLTRSPLKARPLRNPGQSSDEALYEKVIDTAPWIAGVFFVALYAVLEWYRYLVPSVPHPIVATAVAVAAMGIGGIAIRRRISELWRLKQGRDGERAVGQYLERLRASGWSVFHDIPAQGFNIDHVLIGAGGVFAVETKTWSKPASGEAAIVVDEAGLSAAGRRPTRDPLAQGLAQARYIAALLKDSTGRKYDVRPVILFPGWFIDDRRALPRFPWVLEPKALPTFLGNEPVCLLDEQVSLAAYHLGRYVRTTD